MDKRSCVARSVALLGVALAVALLPMPAAALGGTGDTGSHPPAASQVLSSRSAPSPTVLGSFTMATPARLEDRSGYDSSYLFSFTRGLADAGEGKTPVALRAKVPGTRGCCPAPGGSGHPGSRLRAPAKQGRVERA